MCITYKCYDRNYVSERTDINKTDGWCECIICHYWYFLNINFKFEAEVYNGCHDSIQKTVNFNDAAHIYC